MPGIPPNGIDSSGFFGSKAASGFFGSNAPSPGKLASKLGLTFGCWLWLLEEALLEFDEGRPPCDLEP
ncbi:hypothetical protein ACLKA6_005588 [Drosophila palustris]